MNHLKTREVEVMLGSRARVMPRGCPRCGQKRALAHEEVGLLTVPMMHKLCRQDQDSSSWRLALQLSAAVLVVFALLTCSSGAALAQEDGAPPADDGEDAAAPTVTNIFFDTDLRQALADIADQARVSIIPDETVTGIVSLELEEEPLEDALDLVLLAGGYVWDKIRPRVYLVLSPDPNSPNFHRIAETEIVELDYISSEELQALLPDLYTQFVKFDTLGVRAVVTAPDTMCAAIVEQIRMLDQPPQQIMIEALIFETTKGTLRDFEISVQDNNIGLGLATGTGVITYTDQADALLAQLLYLSQKDRANIKANPHVVTQEGREAEVSVSVEQWFQVQTGRAGFEYSTLQPVEARIGLTITPHISADGKVTCQLSPEVDDVIGVGPGQLPIITKRMVESTVRIRDGQVIAIGGLLEQISRHTRRKVPILGDIPLIGQLFRSKHTETLDREVVIFVCPHILDESGYYQTPLMFDRVPTPEAERDRPYARETVRPDGAAPVQPEQPAEARRLTPREVRESIAGPRRGYQPE